MGISTEELRGLIPPEHPFWARLERLYGTTTTAAPTTPPPPSTIASEFDSASNSSRFDAEAVIGKFLSRTRRAFMSRANNLNSRRIWRKLGIFGLHIHQRGIRRGIWRRPPKLERCRHHLFRLKRNDHGSLKVEKKNLAQNTKFPVVFCSTDCSRPSLSTLFFPPLCAVESAAYKNKCPFKKPLFLFPTHLCLFKSASLKPLITCFNFAI